MLEHVLVDMWVNGQNEMIFLTSNCKVLYLTMPIVCRKNLNQNVHMDCKIITLEEEEKVLFGEEP